MIRKPGSPLHKFRSHRIWSARRQSEPSRRGWFCQIWSHDINTAIDIMRIYLSCPDCETCISWKHKPYGVDITESGHRIILEMINSSNKNYQNASLWCPCTAVRWVLAMVGHAATTTRFSHGLKTCKVVQAIRKGTRSLKQMPFRNNKKVQPYWSK